MSSPHHPSKARPSRPLKRRSERGFTLTELLLASLLGVIITSAIYQVFVKTTTNYSLQLEHTQAQSSLRFATERVKAELRDFGRLTILNTSPEQRDPLYCGDRAYTGLELKDNDRGGDGYVLPEALTLNNIRPDRLRLLIDPSNATPLMITQQSGARLTLGRPQDQLTKGAQRLVAPGSEARLRWQYEGGLARVTQVSTGRYDVVPVSAVLADQPSKSIRLAESPCASLACTAGGCVMNPLHWVEFAITEHTRSPTITQLVRRRLDVDSGEPVANSELVLADYVVDFQVWGDYDTRGLDPRAPGANVNAIAPLVPTDPRVNDDQGNWVIGGLTEAEVMNRWPHRLRGLSFLLAVRTPRVDPSFTVPPALANPTPQERLSFRVQTAERDGLARVSTLTGVVDNANLYRGD